MIPYNYFKGLSSKHSFSLSNSIHLTNGVLLSYASSEIINQKVFIAISNTVFYPQVWTGIGHAAELSFLLQAIKSFICGVAVDVAPTSFLKLLNKILAQTEQKRKMLSQLYIPITIINIFSYPDVSDLLYESHIIADTCITITSHKDQYSHES